MVMRQNISDVGMGHQVDAETVRRGPQVPPAELEKRAQVIASAAMDMTHDFKKLEDRCDECAAEAHGAENTSTIT